MPNSASSRSLPLWLILLAIISALSLAASLVWEAKRGPGKEALSWHTPEEPLPKGVGAPRWVLYDFSAAWCGPCKALDRQVFRKPEYASWIAKDFFPVRVMDRMREDGRNSPAITALQEKYKVEAFPTLVLQPLDPGREPKIKTGFGGENEVAAFLKSISQAAGTAAELKVSIAESDLAQYSAKAPSKAITMREEQFGTKVLFFCSNGTDKDRDLSIRFPIQNNVSFSKSVPLILRVPAGKEIYALSLAATNPRRTWRYEYRYQIMAEGSSR